MQFYSLSDEIKKYPFVRISIAFIIGILIAINSGINYYIALSTFFVAFIALIFLSSKSRFSYSLYIGILLNLAFVLAGYMLTVNKLESSKNEMLSDYEGYMLGKLVSDPVVRDRSVRVNVDIIALKHNELWHKTSGRTLLYLSPDERTSDISVGSYIIFTPQLSEVENRGNPSEFNYKRYLSYNLIHTSDFLSSDQWDFVGDIKDRHLKYRALNFRQDLISKLESNGLNEDELGVISALALGYRNRLSDELRHSYASSGAMHILAVSGLHVGIVYMIIVFALSFMKSRRLLYLRVFLTIVLIWFYAVLTGLSPSVSRAATMFSFIAVSSIFQRSPGVYNSIAASAFLLLIINPLMLTQIGFQLSYIAVLGIVIIFPKIYPIFKFNNYLLDKIWALTVVSVSAQIATAPIAIYYFNQFSNYFLLTNYLLMPLAGVAIYLCLSVFIFSGIPVLSNLLANALAFVVKTMNYFATTIESLPGSLTSGIHLNFTQLISLYLIIIFSIFFFFITKTQRDLKITIFLLIFFAGNTVIKNINRSDQQYIIVYNINRASVLNIIDGRDNILFADLSNNRTQSNLEFSAKNHWLKLGLDKEKYIDINSLTGRNILSNIATIDNKAVFNKANFISYKDKRMLLVNRNFKIDNYINTDDKKMQLHYIILSDNVNIKLTDIIDRFDFSKIIIDSSNTSWRINNWKKENDDLQLPIFDVTEQGAFVSSI